MADDKGGGSSWGALEIAIIILLAIGLLNRLTNRTPSTISDTVVPRPETKQGIPLKELTATRCGLVLATPQQNQKVSTFVVISGSVNGCEWNATPEVALYAQLVDIEGNLLSDYTAIPVVTYEEGVATFNTTISITSPAGNRKGYAIFIPAISHSEKTTTARIPIIFK